MKSRSREFQRGTQAVGIVVGISLGIFVVGSGCKPKAPAHGVEFLIEVHSGQINDADYQQTVGALRKRLDIFGRAAPFFQTNGNNRVRIQVAALSDPERATARRQITNSSVLEFRLVHSDSDDLVKQGEVPSGWELLKQNRRVPDHTSRAEPLIVKKEPVRGLTSRAIQSAAVARDPLGRPEIVFELTPEGTRIFAEVTRTFIDRRLAMVLNGEVLTAPVIKGPIEQGTGEITGDFSSLEAFEFANLLKNPLNATVRILEERSF